MAKRIFLTLAVLLLVAAVGSYAYGRYRTDRRLNGGEVLSADGGRVVGDDGQAPILTPTRSETPEARVQRQPAASTSTSATTAPRMDSIPSNPPNGMAFTGAGKFQVYRQGDLTWRVNTDDGRTCILFATMDEWRKPIVYRNACG